MLCWRDVWVLFEAGSAVAVVTTRSTVTIAARSAVAVTAGSTVAFAARSARCAFTFYVAFGFRLEGAE